VDHFGTAGGFVDYWKRDYKIRDEDVLWEIKVKELLGGGGGVIR
jgi:hypothetical protein